MRITSIRLFQYSLPFQVPVTIAGRTLEQRSGFLVRVEGESGTCGWGDAVVLPGFNRETEAETRRQLVAAKLILEGRDPGSESIASGNFLPDHKVTGSARFALELAFANLVAAAEQISLAKVFGANPVPHILQNALLTGSASQICEDACRLKQSGYISFKLKVGRQSLEEDVRLVREVRRIIGPAVSLRLDANRAWTPENARKFLMDTRSCALEYIEEPVKIPCDLPDLVRDTGVPVALDETVRDIEVSSLADHVYSRAIILKPSVLGGPGRAMRLATEAIRLGMLPVVSASFESGIGMAGLVALSSNLQGGNIPAGLDTYRWLATDVLKTRLPLEEGTIDVDRVLAHVNFIDTRHLEEIA